MDEELRWSNIGRLLLLAFEAFDDRVVEGLRAAGFDDFTSSHGKALRNVDLGGTQISEIARRAQMTKQGMSQLIVDLERRGYVERQPDSADGRAKRVHLTDRGRELISVGQSVYRELEHEWSEALRDPDLQSLRVALQSILAREKGRSANK